MPPPVKGLGFIVSTPTIIAIGNGPSLREVSLPSLRGVHTLGMNAAYRHWEKIDWWPTYYACADHRLAMSHIAFFREAALSRRFRAMLLPASVLDEAPELAECADVTFVDQFLPYWFNQLDPRFGRKLLRDPFFDTQRPASMTTGAMSLRWALSMGYRRLGLLGIDCTYQPMKEWARDEATPIALRIGQPVASNPNYFFDDYQRVGDLFNVPSPETHSGNLHLEAIASVRDDLSAIDCDAGLEVLSERSALCASGVLPYTPLATFLDRGRIALLLIDARAAESGEPVVAALDAWDDPARAPAVRTHLEDRTLAVLIGSRAGPGASEAIARFFEGSFLLRRIFRSIEIRTGEDVAGSLAEFSRTHAGLALTLPLGARALRPRWLDAIEHGFRSTSAASPSTRSTKRPYLTDLREAGRDPNAARAGTGAPNPFKAIREALGFTSRLQDGSAFACPGAVAADGATTATELRVRHPEAVLAYGIAPGRDWIDDEGSPMRVRLQSDGLVLTEIRSDSSREELTLDPAHGDGLSFHVARLDRTPFYPEDRLELSLTTAEGRQSVSLILMSSEKLPVSGRALTALEAGSSTRASLEMRGVSEAVIVTLTPLEESGSPVKLRAFGGTLEREGKCIARARASRPWTGPRPKS